MKKLLLFILLMNIYVWGQQINRTWGYQTDGTEWNQSGTTDTDSIATVSIVFDLQDYYFMDWNPLALDSVTVLYNSDALFIGTFWLRIDVENATDSSGVLIEAFPGNMIYHPNDESRITTDNLNFSTTAITIQDSTSYTTGDVEWTAYNIYLDASTRILPSEFVKLTLEQKPAANDSIDYRWDFAYPAVYESEQGQRTSRGDLPAKDEATLH